MDVAEIGFERLHDKANKMTCALDKDSDQPGHHPPSLISLLVCSVGS